MGKPKFNHYLLLFTHKPIDIVIGKNHSLLLCSKTEQKASRRENKIKRK